MPLRKKKTVRDQLEERLDDFLSQADQPLSGIESES